jgi:hypothetical protein
MSETTDLHQPPPERQAVALTRHSCRRNLPGACWPHAEQEGPPWPWLDTTGPEEADDHHGRGRACVDKKNLLKTTDLAPKISSKFACPDNTFAGDTTNNRSPQPATSVASAIKAKKKKATEMKKLHSSKAMKKTTATTETSGRTKLHSPRGWETLSFHWYTPRKAKKTTLAFERQPFSLSLS